MTTKTIPELWIERECLRAENAQRLKEEPPRCDAEYRSWDVCTSAIFQQLMAVERLISDTPAATIDDVLIKLRIAGYWVDLEYGSGRIVEAEAEEMTLEERMTLSAYRDIKRIPVADDDPVFELIRYAKELWAGNDALPNSMSDEQQNPYRDAVSGADNAVIRCRPTTPDGFIAKAAYLRDLDLRLDGAQDYDKALDMCCPQDAEALFVALGDDAKALLDQGQIVARAPRSPMRPTVTMS